MHLQPVAHTLRLLFLSPAWTEIAKQRSEKKKSVGLKQRRRRLARVFSDRTLRLRTKRRGGDSAARPTARGTARGARSC